MKLFKAFSIIRRLFHRRAPERQAICWTQVPPPWTALELTTPALQRIEAETLTALAAVMGSIGAVRIQIEDEQ